MCVICDSGTATNMTANLLQWEIKSNNKNMTGGKWGMIFCFSLSPAQSLYYTQKVTEGLLMVLHSFCRKDMETYQEKRDKDAPSIFNPLSLCFTLSLCFVICRTWSGQICRLQMPSYSVLSETTVCLFSPTSPVCVWVCVCCSSLIESVVRILMSMSGIWFCKASSLTLAHQAGGEVRGEVQRLDVVRLLPLCLCLFPVFSVLY